MSSRTPDGANFLETVGNSGQNAFPTLQEQLTTIANCGEFPDVAMRNRLPRAGGGNQNASAPPWQTNTSSDPSLASLRWPFHDSVGSPLCLYRFLVQPRPLATRTSNHNFWTGSHSRDAARRTDGRR